MALTKTDTLNYRGELFLIGQNQTPFLRTIAGRAARSNAFVFPMAQPWALNAAAQPAITEDDSVAAGTPTTYTRAEDTNTAQIMKYDAAVSFKKQGTFGQLSGINTLDGAPITDELAFQKAAALRQMAIDLEFSFLQGAYQAATNTATAAKTRGIIAGTATNAVAASAATLSEALIKQLLRTMVGSGAPMANPVVFVNAFQKQKLTEIFGYAPTDRNVGGLNIKQIETDFGMLGVVYDPFMPIDTLQIAELSVCRPVFVPVSFSGNNNGITNDSVDGVDVLWVDTAITGAAKGGFYYSQVGLDYGAEEYHGKITGLATA